MRPARTAGPWAILFVVCTASHCGSKGSSNGPGGQAGTHTPQLFVLTSRSNALATGDDPVIVTSYFRGADGRVSDAPIAFDASGAVPQGLQRDRYGVQVGTLTSTTVGPQTLDASGGGLSTQASVTFQAATPWRHVAFNLSGSRGILFIDPTDPDIVDVSPQSGGGNPLTVYETVNGGADWTLRFSATPTYGPTGPTFTGDAGAYLFSYVVADPLNAGVYVVSSDATPTPSPCLQRSDDWGATWQPVSCSLALANPIFDSTEPNMAYALLGTGGVARSIDDGLTWAPVTALVADPDSTLLTIADVPGTAGSLAVVEQQAAGTMRLWTSTDGGVSWVSHAGPPIESPGVIIEGPRAHGLYAPDSQTFYFCYPGALWKSGDGGNTWTSARSWPDPFATGTCLFALDPQNPAVALLVDPSQNELLRTTDGAATWTPVVQNVPIDDVVFDPQHDDTAYASTGRGVLKSADNGQTWTGATTGVPLDATAAMFSVGTAAPYPVVMQTSGGLYRSTDTGATWQHLDAYPSVTGDTKIPSNHWIAQPDASTILVIPFVGTTGPTAVERSADGGNTWQAISLPQGVDSISAAPDEPAAVYLSSSISSSSFLVSADGGTTWKTTPLPTAGGAAVYAGAKGTVFLMMMVGAGDQRQPLYVSHDHGSTFTLAQLPPGGYGSVDVLDMAVDPSDATRAWAFASAQGLTGQRTLIMTTDGGNTWSTPGSSSPLAAGGWFGPLVAPDNPETLCVITLVPGSPVPAYISTDAGITWQPLAMPGAMLALASSKIFLSGAGDGLYRTTSAGR